MDNSESLISVTSSNLGKKSIWRRCVRYYIGFLVAILLFVGGLALGAYLKEDEMLNGAGSVTNNDTKPLYLNKEADFNLYWTVWQEVKDKYFDPEVKDTQLFYGSMVGMVDALRDPYSVFLPPDLTAEFVDALEGNFEGIGAEVAIKNDMVTIVAPLPDSPAARAGLMAGDVIVKIDNADTSTMSLDFAISKIRGPQGTTVTLSIYRDGWTEFKDFKIRREQIVVASLTFEVRENKYAYIKLSQFNADTYPALDKAIKQIEKNNLQGIILDLRNNPGGYLDTAVEVASEWISKGEKVVLEKKRDGSVIEYKSQKEPRLKNIKTVVLVDNGSASASEILAGALKDYGIAKIVGAQTFGKGSVQDYQILPDNSSLKLTVAKWLTPLGNAIDGVGIKPDVEVKLTEEDFNKNKDPQLDKAWDILKEELSK